MTPMDSIMQGWRNNDVRIRTRNESRLPLSQFVNEWEEMGLYDLIWPSSTLPTANIEQARPVGMRLNTMVDNFLQPDFQMENSIAIWLKDRGYLVDWADGPDTLMSSINIDQRGWRIADFMRSERSDVLYGPMMLKIFEAIGYATLSNPRYGSVGPLENLASIEYKAQYEGAESI